jgi:GT2 family glycosyltransferase
VIDGSLSIVVVDYYAGQSLKRCVESILSQSGLPLDVTVVDNSGEGASAVALASLRARVPVIASTGNVGFAAAANRGFALTRGRWVGFVNPDIVVSPTTATHLLEFLAAHPAHAAVGPVLRGSDGLPQPYSYGAEPTPAYLARRALSHITKRPLHDWGLGSPREVDWVSGACLFTRREVFERVGGFDERFFMYFEDVDWCRRCRADGWRIGILATTQVEHGSWASYGDAARRRYYRESLRHYYAKYYGFAAALAVSMAQRLTPS